MTRVLSKIGITVLDKLPTRIKLYTHNNLQINFNRQDDCYPIEL